MLYIVVLYIKVVLILLVDQQQEVMLVQLQGHQIQQQLHILAHIKQDSIVVQGKMLILVEHLHVVLKQYPDQLVIVHQVNTVVHIIVVLTQLVE